MNRNYVLYSVLLVALILVGMPRRTEAGIYPYYGSCCYYGCGYYPCYPDISLPPYFATHPPVYYGLPGVWPYGGRAYEVVSEPAEEAYFDPPVKQPAHVPPLRIINPYVKQSGDSAAVDTTGAVLSRAKVVYPAGR